MLDRHMRGGARTILGLLDVGTWKVACMIVEVGGRAGDRHSIRLLGLGHQRARGVKAGVVVNLEEAASAIRAAIGQAERMAGVTIDAVLVAVACGRIRSANFTARVDLAHGVVEDDDIARAFAAADAYVAREGRSLVQLTPNGFQLDGASGADDPRGMAGRRLALHVNAVTADDAPLRNLLAAIEHCHVAVGGVVAAPYASARAVTTQDERAAGVVCIDMGAGITTASAFAHGRMVWADVILMGGSLLTYAIAEALGAPLAEAERIKVLYGTMAQAMSGELEVISCPLAGEAEAQVVHVTRARLTSLAEPRIAMLLAQFGERLRASGVEELAGGRVVLTGGASQLAGLGEYAADRLGKPVRIGRAHVPGLPQSVCGPAFSAVLGLLEAALEQPTVVQAYRDRRGLTPGYLGRFREWVRESF